MKLALELPIPSDELRQACEAQLRSFEAQGETAGGDTWEGLRQTVDELFDVNVDQRSIPPTAGVGVCDRLRAEARALCAQASADQEGVIHGVS